MKGMKELGRWSVWTFTLTLCINLLLNQSSCSAQPSNLSFIVKDKRYDISGDLPTLCVVNNNTALQFSSTGHQLVYDVFTIKPDGSINVIALENNHESSHTYNSSYIAVHLDSNTIIEVVQDNNSHLYYRTGVLNGGLINWQTADVIPYADGGRKPSVVVTKSRAVISVYEGTESDTPSLYYKLGHFDQETKKIQWYTPFTYATGYSPKVALTKDGTLIEVHCLADKGLYYIIGTLDETAEKINWLNKPVLYRSCHCKSIDLMVDPFNIIVESHNEDDSLYYTTGKLQDSSIKWNNPTQYSSGSNPAITFLPGYNHPYVFSYTTKVLDQTELSINTLAFDVELVHIEYGKPNELDSIPFAVQVTEFNNNGPLTLTQTWILEQQCICTNTYNWESSVHLGISVNATVKFFAFETSMTNEISIDLTIGHSSSASELFKWTEMKKVTTPPKSGKLTYTATIYRTPYSIPFTTTFKRGDITWTETGTVEVTHGAIYSKIVS